MTDLATIVLTSVGLMGLLALMLYLLGLASSAADRRAAYERALAEGLDLAALRAKIDAEDEWPTATYHPIGRAELLALLAAVETRPAAVASDLAIVGDPSNVLPTTEAVRKAEAAWQEAMAELRSKPLEVYRPIMFDWRARGVTDLRCWECGCQLTDARGSAVEDFTLLSTQPMVACCQSDACRPKERPSAHDPAELARAAIARKRWENDGPR